MGDLDEIKRMLEDLTPGGSEFHDSPRNCVQWITERLEAGKAAQKELALLRRETWVPLQDGQQVGSVVAHGDTIYILIGNGSAYAAFLPSGARLCQRGKDYGNLPL